MVALSLSEKYILSALILKTLTPKKRLKFLETSILKKEKLPTQNLPKINLTESETNL